MNLWREVKECVIDNLYDELRARFSKFQPDVRRLSEQNDRMEKRSSVTNIYVFYLSVDILLLFDLFHSITGTYEALQYELHITTFILQRIHRTQSMGELMLEKPEDFDKRPPEVSSDFFFQIDVNS